MVTTSFTDLAQPSSAQPGPEIVSATEPATTDKTSSSIAEMIQELSQVGDSEIPTTEAGGVSTSAVDMAEELPQAEKSHERIASPIS